MPLTNRTRGDNPRASSWVSTARFGVPTTTSSRHASCGRKASASMSTLNPLSGTFALVIVVRRPGTRWRAEPSGQNVSTSTPGADVSTAIPGALFATPASGVNVSTSTPTGMTLMRSRSTPNSRTMSSRLVSLTVMMRLLARATRACIGTNEYQRHFVYLRHGFVAASISRRRSALIGWWIVVTTGRPPRAMSSRPGASVWLSCRTSNSLDRVRISRASRIPNVRGSGNEPDSIPAYSTTSMRSRSSRGWG